MKTSNKKTAFTLAEVLITLAIIGVVAVLTVPTLIANNQEKGWNTASKVFEAKLEQALKVMNTQGTLAGYRTTKDFVDELSNHLKIVKVCDSDKLTDCFSDTVWWGSGEATPEEVDISTVKTAKHFGQKDWSIDTEVLGFQLNNGTNGLIAYNPDCRQDQFSNQITGTACVAVLYDTSGFSKPNTSGKDMRSINVSSLGGKDCAFEIGGTCYGAPFVPTPMTYAECAGENATSANNITTAGAEASALGIKQCYYEKDYWAGAVKACGGTNKMASASQLADIANYIYNTDQVQAKNEVESLTMDTSKATSLGFTLNSLNNFFVWSGEEYSRGDGAYDRLFNSTSTKYYSYEGRRNPSAQAVCLQ